jgi:molecular chaperone DnaK
MVKEAEEHGDEDKRKRALAEAKNNADNLIYSTEKSLREIGDKIDSGDRKRIEDAITNLKKVIDGEDVNAIQSATEALTQASYKLAEAVYARTSQQQAQGQNSGADQGGQQSSSGSQAKSGDEEVVDADYEVVDDDSNKNEK